MKSSHKNRDSLNPKQLRFAENISLIILKKQRKAANYLNKKTDRFNARTWRLILLGFCLLSGGYFLNLILNALR